MPVATSTIDITHIAGTPMREEEEVEKLLIQTTGGGPLLNVDDGEYLRISLAGAQEKIALLWHSGAWMHPTGRGSAFAPEV